ncbi:MAG TPA: O-antigen ligase family protein [Gaiellaceae bacterium]|nr:O-antigen ligase family protein [Gaiellaceae bacterium]
MRPLAGSAARTPVAPALAFLLFGSLVAAAITTTAPVQKLAPVVFGVVLLAASYRWVLRWRNLVLLTVLVILFIPMRRYSLPSSLPFQLEPYRVVVAFLALAWITSLLIDPRVRLRRTGVEGPFGLYVLAVFVSMVLNAGRVAAVSSILTKTLMFTASYFVILYLLPSVLSRRSDVDVVIKTFVTGGALVALAAVVESRTNYNVFNHLTKVMPFLHLGQLPFQNGVDATGMSRGGRIRAYASAEHPIALGAALVMLMPLAFYLVKRTGQKRWWACLAFMLLGLFATVSRTGFLMLIVSVAIIVWYRRREMKRYWPALLPAIVVIHFAVPGTLGTMVQSFFPKGGLIAQQTHQNVGSGRLATLGPVIHSEFDPHPIFGEGFGTRVSGDNGPNVKANAPILDDQWAGVLVETGVFGAFAFAWIFVRSVRMLGRWARENDDADGWLAVALAAGIGGFGVGMFTFDAFSFIQVTFVFYFLIALAGASYARFTRMSALRRVAAEPAR